MTPDPPFTQNLATELRRVDTFGTGHVHYADALAAAERVHDSVVGPLVQSIELALRHLDPNENRGESAAHARIKLRSALDGLERGTRWVREDYTSELNARRQDANNRLSAENRRLRGLAAEALAALVDVEPDIAALADWIQARLGAESIPGSVTEPYDAGTAIRRCEDAAHHTTLRRDLRERLGEVLG